MSTETETGADGHIRHIRRVPFRREPYLVAEENRENRYVVLLPCRIDGHWLRVSQAARQPKPLWIPMLLRSKRFVDYGGNKIDAVHIRIV